MITFPPEKKLLAALEAVERDAWIDLHRAADEGTRSALGLAHDLRGGTVLTAARQIDLGLFNRALGMGSAGPTSAADLAEAAEWLAARCHPGWRMDVVPDALPADFEERMRAIGLARKGIGSAKLYRGAPASPVPTEANCPHPIRPVTGGTLRACVAVVDAAFGMAVSTADWTANLVGRPGWSLFAAFDGDEPVAFGLMYRRGDWAWLGSGATSPAHRGRGCQSALLRRRLAEGSAQGAKHFAIECAAPEPGSEAAAWASYRNAVRAGFAPAYTRVLYGPA